MPLAALRHVLRRGLAVQQPQQLQHVAAAASCSSSMMQVHHQAAAAAAALPSHQPQSGGSSGGTRQQRSWWQAVAGAVTAAAAAGAVVAGSDACVAHADASSSSSSSSSDDSSGDGVAASGKVLSLATRQRIWFKYESRIRTFSSLEKIFEYFATHRQDGGKVMSAQDVVRALVPTFPPAGSNVERAGFLDGERGAARDVRSAHESIMAFFDTDKDGTLGFNEFVLVVICLAVPEKDADVVFDVMDLDNNGFLDEQEFMQVLKMLEKRAGIQPNFAGRVGKHAVAAKGDGETRATHHLFLAAGGKGVSLALFRAFLRKLQAGMLRLEFAHYDTKGTGKISGTDFATSLVTAADIKSVDGLLDKAQSLPLQLAAAQISLPEFEDMAQLRRNMHLLSFALDFCTQIQRPLSKSDFAKLLQRSLGVTLSQPVLDIVFAVFGDAAGMLDGPAMVRVMKARNRVPGYRKGQGLGVGADGSDSSMMTLWSCLRNCVTGPSAHDPFLSSASPPAA